MMDPALKSSLSELAAVLQRVNEESDALTAFISEFEKSLIDMRPGFDVWVPPFNVEDPTGVYSRAQQLGFAKVSKTWGVFLCDGQFTRSVGSDDWGPTENVTYTRLVDASRDERIAAVEHFPALVDKMKEAASERLTALADVNSNRVRW